MSVAKVIEINASSPDSFEDAVRIGIDRTKETVDNIQGAWVKEMKVDVRDGEVTNYYVDLKVTFVLKS
jgi:flavin-binding protein dodecin